MSSENRESLIKWAKANGSYIEPEPNALASFEDLKGRTIQAVVISYGYTCETAILLCTDGAYLHVSSRRTWEDSEFSISTEPLTEEEKHGLSLITDEEYEAWKAEKLRLEQESINQRTEARERAELARLREKYPND